MGAKRALTKAIGKAFRPKEADQFFMLLFSPDKEVGLIKTVAGPENVFLDYVFK